MMKAGMAEPACTKRLALVVIVQKKDRCLLFRVSYSLMNTVSVRDSYPIPRKKEYIDSIGEGKVFSTLDANSRYWQIRMVEKHVEKDKVRDTVCFAFSRMPFELKNALATLNTALGVIGVSEKWEYALVNLDYIIIYSSQHCGSCSILKRLSRCLEMQASRLN